MTKKGTILVTGAAGFIGFSVSKRLLALGHQVVGLDNFNDYYDVELKEARTKILLASPNYKIVRGDLADEAFLNRVINENHFDSVCHLAAQAGVRHSIDNPASYIRSNILGFANLIEMAKNNSIMNFIFASSSSVYGDSAKSSFSPGDNTDQPISIYAATKKADELIAHTYHHLFSMNCTALRFFSVYGPWGRPDMAYYAFAKNIMAGETISLYNHGNNARDFTYIDDIVDGVVQALDKCYPWEIFNLGSGRSVELGYFVEVLEKNIGKKAEINYLEPQPGDAVRTLADISHTKRLLGYEPKSKFELGMKYFAEWFLNYSQ